ncbi:carboxylesterase/lipase family protein [Kineococcus indalonis]|uniref:carboxylesterase/lipase family protein n=1 Tax=Kineococcus indalonis TaxID=2696566 RepID=UPI002B1BE39E|nr:carboxylesterase family protein [Kineococcus indalonis]
MSTAPEVSTRSGRLRGVQRPGSAAFLGVPFARPPVGPRRFAAPVPAEPWEGVRPAVAHGPTPQRVPFGPVTTIPEPSVPGEATLNVDVFTPAPGDRSALLPVLVWVHGGGYFAGSPASPWYDGAAFNRDGVVTVNVSYRLGFDGFGWVGGAPLNRGLLDQLAALRWVRENVRDFGGDPDRVTVAGQSAGGGSVLSLLASPPAARLFRRVVSHSSATSDLPPALAEEAGRRFAAHFGVTPDLAGWRSVPEAEVVAAERGFNAVPGRAPRDGASPDVAAALRAARAGASVLASMAFTPVVDGVVLPSDVATALAGGAGADVEVLMGTTRDEFAVPAAAGAQEVVRDLVAAGVDDEGVAAFRADVARTGERFAANRALVAAGFRAELVRLAAARARGGAGARTWLFDFAERSPVEGVAAHCHDLPYAFDLLGAPGVARVLGEHPDQALADRVHGHWVRFVREGAPPWPAAGASPLGAQRYGDGSAFDPRAYVLDAQVAGLG